jgi:heme/copper-type cytochrome/quinol oxidase subunit 4
METNQPAQTPEDKAHLRRQLIKFFLFLGVTVGIALWMMIDDIWPASALIDLQAGWFDGEYYPKLTFAIVWIIVLLAIVAVIAIGDWLWSMVKGKK